jgi:hypothetical protein
MRTLSIAIWAIAIFGSIFWYAFLVFYIGYQASREILNMVRVFEARKPPRTREEI